MKLRTVVATRYVTPLREGGSLPAIVEADDDGMYVLKFRGAGQGPKVLIAELVAGEIARAAGLPVPEIVFMELDPDLARTEPDSEIQELIKGSAGLNLALDYLPGAATFDPLVACQTCAAVPGRPQKSRLLRPVTKLLSEKGPQAAFSNELAEKPAADLASDIVWFDAYVTNVDRTARNANMLMWHRHLRLIDHGAALYFHHSWDRYLERSNEAFHRIRDHILLPFASSLREADAKMSARIAPQTITDIVAMIPDAWLTGPSPFNTREEHRAAYIQYLLRRLEQPHAFLEEAIRARSQLV